MENYYSLLGLKETAGTDEIKKAFRNKAKHLHPDIAGEAAEEKMRKLLTAYKLLLDPKRRFEYDRAYKRFSSRYHFDYKTFLKNQDDDPVSMSKLIFFELLHLEEEEAISIWDKQGGLDFPMERHIDREDWMDCNFLLAEELAKHSRFYESFILLLKLVREERRAPYFKHFMDEVESFLKELVRLHLRQSVDIETYADCLETLIGMGFAPKDRARWMRSLADALFCLGETIQAQKIFREAIKLDPGLPKALKLRKKLKVY